MFDSRRFQDAVGEQMRRQVERDEAARLHEAARAIVARAREGRTSDVTRWFQQVGDALAAKTEQGGV